MLVNYLVEISTGASGVYDEPSIGFSNGIYHFSTAGKEGYFRCLDGSSFSAISQQNAIVRGGELSVMDKTEIVISSREVMNHIDGKGISLLGARVSMRYELEGRPAQAIFSGMTATSFSEKSESSFSLLLEDSAFARAAPLSLSRPGQAGDSGELSTWIGEQVWLPIRMLPRQGRSYSQGRHEDYFGEQRDLEGCEAMRGGRPAFSQSFPLVATEDFTTNRQEGKAFRFIVGAPPLAGGENGWYPWPLPEISPFEEGMTVEVYAGKGAGDKYKIKKVREVSGCFAGWSYNDDASKGRRMVELELFPSPKGKVQPVMEANGEMLLPEDLPAGTSIAIDIGGSYPVAHDAYRAALKVSRRSGPTEYTQVSGHSWTLGEITLPVAEGGSLDEPKDVSFLRVSNEGYYYYIVTGKNAEFYYNAVRGSQRPGIIFDVGLRKPSGGIESYSQIEFNLAEEGEGYKVFLEASDLTVGDRICLDGVRRIAPRYRLAEFSHVNKRYEPASVEKTKRSGEPARLLPIEKEAKSGKGRLWVSPGGEPAEGLETVFRVSKGGNIGGECFADIHAYWRLDGIEGLEGMDSAQPEFAVEVTGGAKYRALFRALLLDDNYMAFETRKYDSGQLHSGVLALSDEAREALSFPAGSAASAKYLYLIAELEVDAGGGCPDSFEARFGAYGLRLKESRKLGDAYMRMQRLDCEIRDPVQLARALCMDYGIGMEPSSFAEASSALAGDIYEFFGDGEREYPCAEAADGARWEEKLSELCRAANFSLHSDGCRLYARYWAKDKGKEAEWAIGEKDIIANSYDVSSPETGYIATDFLFSVPTESGDKALNFSAPEKGREFSREPEPLEGDGFEGDVMEEYPRGLEKPLFMGGAQIWLDTLDGHLKGLAPESLHEICSLANPSKKGIYRLLDMRRSAYGYTSCIFEFQGGHPQSSNWREAAVMVRPLKRLEKWQEIFSGGYPLDISSAEWLFLRSQSALETANKHIKMDERYTKHKAMAFTSPETWLKSILNTVAHNTYKKVLVKFSVPLDMLPEGGLHGLILKRARLEFGWFRKRPISGWVIGCSLSPGRDAADLAFLSSEPMPDIKRYNENLLDDQTVIDEREANPGKIIKEA